VGVEQFAARERLGHRVDREVALRQVGEDVVVAQGHEVHVPRVVRADDAPRAEVVAEPERRPARGACEPPRVRPRVPGHRQVDVVRLAPEQLVAHGAADDPDVLAGQGGRDDLERI